MCGEWGSVAAARSDIVSQRHLVRYRDSLSFSRCPPAPARVQVDFWGPAVKLPITPHMLQPSAIRMKVGTRKRPSLMMDLTTAWQSETYNPTSPELAFTNPLHNSHFL